ncbi:MAG: 2-octaprenyl-6-methoxyphenyl hydroxylase, partial [Marinobacter adhaerens]|nr:2-octaprenyl-6-methoxyphenyl hydroxylase [Marinobacter adhaerens]
RLFGHSMLPVAAARDAGLVGLDLLPGAKRWFARKAMGLGGRRAVIERPGNLNREAPANE